MSKSCGGACGGDATSAADTDIQASSEAPGRWVSVYAVPKMDCPSEERMIRLALNGFEEIRALSFDLSNRRLKVVHDGEVEPVTSKLKTLGLGASLQETVAANPETIKAAEFSAASAKQESGTLRWLLGINALLFVVEMTAGLIARSTGLIGESLDNFADAAVYGLQAIAHIRQGTGYDNGHGIIQKCRFDLLLDIAHNDLRTGPRHHDDVFFHCITLTIYYVTKTLRFSVQHPLQRVVVDIFPCFFKIELVADDVVVVIFLPYCTLTFAAHTSFILPYNV